MNNESTPSTTPDQKAAKPTRSTLEKVFFRGFVLASLALIAFEARAKYGYDFTIAYLKRATDAEDAQIAKMQEDIKAGKKTAQPAPEIEPATWGGLRGEAFGSVSFLAPILAGQAGEPVHFMPVLATRKGEDKPIQLKDKDGNILKLQPEKSFERSLRWHSLRDLWSPEPVYMLAIQVAGEGDDAEINGFSNGPADGNAAKNFANPDQLKPSEYDPDAPRELAAPGGGRTRPNRQRPSNQDDEDDKDEDDKGEDESPKDAADNGDDEKPDDDDDDDEK